MNETNDLQKLRDWLADYALYRDLRIPEDTSEAEPADDYDFSAEPAPAAGQIRLWPSTDPGEDPLYGLLLPAGYGNWKVVPFSPLAFPAVPEELRWLEHPPARVLEGWNRRRLPAPAVRRSWCVDTLSDAVCFQLQSWLLSVEAGDEAPATLENRIGPPIYHPLDPRYDYLNSESARVDGCMGEASGGYRTEAVEPRALAAEGEAGYALRVWRIEGEVGARVKADASGINLEGLSTDWTDLEIVGEDGVRVRWNGGRIRFPGANRVKWLRIEASQSSLGLMEDM